LFWIRSTCLDEKDGIWKIPVPLQGIQNTTGC
jgi:hypothetical protein